MADVVIVGDGPAGLGAALFLAKRGLETVVLGTDQTLMHKAMVYNYLGLPEITGPEFQRVAREQVAALGARLETGTVVSAAASGDGFVVGTDDGREFAGRYLVLAAGPKHDLAKSLGLTEDASGGVAADRDGRTAVDRLYCIGWSVRPMKIQAIISAGDGAAAALDILSRENGKELHDFDSLPA